ncbi:MAG: hypothetical protein IPK20_18090 [Betaproteobacteria bacterium]|nr:hypothetical protein [Betaproteobacteria bacterium]
MLNQFHPENTYATTSTTSTHGFVEKAPRRGSRTRKAALLGTALTGMLALPPTIGSAGEPSIKVTDESFKCISQMTKVRHFYVDNLAGKLPRPWQWRLQAAATTPRVRSCN